MSRARRRPPARRRQRPAPRAPPVPVPEQAHRRRHEQRPDDGRVEGDRERHPDAERLDQDDVGERERGRDDDDDQRRGRHDPAAPLEAAGDRLLVVVGPVPDLLHPRQQEHLVVHRQPEQHAEQDHRLGGLDEPQRLEPERPRQVAVLEDPDERPERRDDRERVHHERLDRQDRRAEQDEQDDVRGHDDEQRRPREVGGDAVDDVGHVRGAAADEDGRARRRSERPGRVPKVRARARGPRPGSAHTA